MDKDAFIQKNKEKREKKMAKRGVISQNINQQARMNVRNIEEPKRKTMAEKSGSVKILPDMNIKFQRLNREVWLQRRIW